MNDEGIDLKLNTNLFLFYLQSTYLYFKSFKKAKNITILYFSRRSPINSSLNSFNTRLVGHRIRSVNFSNLLSIEFKSLNDELSSEDREELAPCISLMSVGRLLLLGNSALVDGL